MPNLIRQLGKNIFSSWVSLGLRIVLVFLINPFIIHTLGDDRYGVWILVISIINYMTVLDLGLKQALIRFVSKYLGLNDFDKVNSIINTTFIVYSAIGIIVILITIILSFFALDWFRIPPELISQGRMALIIIGLSTAINFVMISYGDSLGAFHRYDISYALMMAEDLLRMIAIVILLKSGYGLAAFAAAFLTFNLLRNIAGILLLRKTFPKVKFSLKFANKETFRKIFNYSLIGFLISIAWMIIVNTDNVLIGYFLSASSVTQYAIAAGFIVYLRSLIIAVSFPLRPLISHYDALNEYSKIEFIYTRGIKYLSFLTFIIGGITIIYADSFILLWMGEGYQQAAVILKILVLPAAITVPQLVANSIMFGTEKHKNLLYIILAEGILNIVISIILVKYYGLYGIAYGTIIPQIIIYLFIVPVIIRTIISFSYIKYYLAKLNSIISAFVISAGLSYLFKLLWHPVSWTVFSIEIIAVIAISAMFGYLLVDKIELKDILNRLKSV